MTLSPYARLFDVYISMQKDILSLTLVASDRLLHENVDVTIFDRRGFGVDVILLYFCFSLSKSALLLCKVYTYINVR